MINKNNHLEYYIEEGLKDEYNIENLTSVLKLSNGDVLPLGSILDSYMNILLPHTSLIKLNDEEKNKYIFRPKLLSYDLYGTIELWYLLLKINKMTDIAEFNKEEILIFNPSELSMINEIIVKENEENYSYI